jgi:hypothetical protein
MWHSGGCRPVIAHRSRRRSRASLISRPVVPRRMLSVLPNLLTLRDNRSSGSGSPGATPALSPEVHPRLEELVQYADAQRAVLLEAVATVPDSARNRRPTADTWSVAEVLEHLHRVEQGIARLIARQVERARASGLAPETDAGSLLHSLDHLAVLERGETMPAPEFVQPRGILTAAAALTALEQSRRTLREALAAGDGMALGSVSVPHVFFGPLTLYQWVLFLGQHECRHAMQIRDIARQLAPP